jgi:hypothetical protein
MAAASTSYGPEVHRVVLDEDGKRAAYWALRDRILKGEGRASPEQRARAFSNAGLPQPLEGRSPVRL